MPALCAKGQAALGAQVSAKVSPIVNCPKWLAYVSIEQSLGISHLTAAGGQIGLILWDSPDKHCLPECRCVQCFPHWQADHCAKTAWQRSIA